MLSPSETTMESWAPGSRTARRSPSRAVRPSKAWMTPAWRQAPATTRRQRGPWDHWSASAGTM
eukprot:3273851-Heterocapsa_arctica.AAC.1